MTVVAALLAGRRREAGPGPGSSTWAASACFVPRGPIPARHSPPRWTTSAPTAVLDLSDEPVVGGDLRMELAARTLARGIPYLGPDFRLDPPVSEPALAAATIAVIGSGKRVAKTAVGGYLAAARRGRDTRPWWWRWGGEVPPSRR